MRIAERVYGQKFTSDTDLISALENNAFPKRAEILAIMTNTLGYEFTSPLEVFRLASGERLAEFEPLSPPPGVPSALEIAGKTFGRTFTTPKDLFDFLDEVPKRDMKYQASLIAAGWRAKKKTPTRRIALEKADQLFSAFVERIPTANSNRKFAFFVQEVLVYGSYLRRQRTVGDIDIAMQFAMKTDAKLKERISFHLRKGAAVDWKEGYGLAISEVSNFLTKRSKYFHDADSANVKRSYPYQLVYDMPELQAYVQLVDQTANSPSVEHLHQFLEQAERRRSEQRHALTPVTKNVRKTPPEKGTALPRFLFSRHRTLAQVTAPTPTLAHTNKLYDVPAILDRSPPPFRPSSPKTRRPVLVLLYARDRQARTALPPPGSPPATSANPRRTHAPHGDLSIATSRPFHSCWFAHANGILANVLPHTLTSLTPEHARCVACSPSISLSLLSTLLLLAPLRGKPHRPARVAPLLSAGPPKQFQQPPRKHHSLEILFRTQHKAVET